MTEWQDPVASRDEAMRRLAEIGAMREQGRMEAALSDEPHYTLTAQYSYPNGTTGDMVTSREEVLAIARRMGLPDPDDSQGWAIWYVPDLAGSKDWA